MSRRLDAAIRKELGYKWDESRCRVCGWPLSATMEEGCIEGDCSMRPVPKPTAIEKFDPLYSTDGNAMLELIGEMEKRGFGTSIEFDGDYGEDKWQVEYYKAGVWPPAVGANTLPLAVALAAYKALSGKEWAE